MYKKLDVNKTALYALILAVLIPLVSYFIIKQLSTDAVHIPKPIYEDTTISKVVKGKIEKETIWQKIPDFTLTNQEGNKVSLHDMVRVDPETGDTVPKIIVANFFFTHCATICPGMTMNIKKLQESIKKSEKVGDRTADFVQFLSFSVDPDRDSVAALKKWADRFQVNPGNGYCETPGRARSRHPARRGSRHVAPGSRNRSRKKRRTCADAAPVIHAPDADTSPATAAR